MTFSIIFSSADTCWEESWKRRGREKKGLPFWCVALNQKSLQNKLNAIRHNLFMSTSLTSKMVFYSDDNVWKWVFTRKSIYWVLQNTISTVFNYIRAFLRFQNLQAKLLKFPYQPKCTIIVTYFAKWLCFSQFNLNWPSNTAASLASIHTRPQNLISNFLVPFRPAPFDSVFSFHVVVPPGKTDNWISNEKKKGASRVNEWPSHSWQSTFNRLIFVRLSRGSNLKILIFYVGEFITEETL